MLRHCEKCNRKRLWFLIKPRWYVSPVGVRVQSTIVTCGVCAKGMKRMFANMKVDKNVGSSAVK